MTVRFGIIGMGTIGAQHYRCASTRANITVTAVADPAPPAPIKDVDLPQDVAVHADWRELLTRDDVDAVSICTPHDVHREMTEAALAAGKHVMLEKPLSHTIDDARAIVDAAAQSDRVLMVELTHRFYPPVVEAQQQVAAGRVGHIYAIEDRVVQPFPPHMPSWMSRKAVAGGGAGLTNGIHLLDRIAAVSSQSLRFVNGAIGYTAAFGDVEDTAALFLTLDDGTPVQVLIAWPKGEGPMDDELTIYGSLGTLRVWAWRGWRFEPIGPDQSPQQHDGYAPDQPIVGRSRIAIGAAIDEFVAAITERRPPNPPPEAALTAQELIEQFYQHTEAIG